MAESPKLTPEQAQRLEAARMIYDKYHTDDTRSLSASERYQSQLGKAVHILDTHNESRGHATNLNVDITIAKNMVREGRQEPDISKAVSQHSPNTCGMAKHTTRDYGELVVEAAKQEIGQDRAREENSKYQTQEARRLILEQSLERER